MTVGPSNPIPGPVNGWHRPAAPPPPPPPTPPSAWGAPVAPPPGAWAPAGSSPGHGAPAGPSNPVPGPVNGWHKPSAPPPPPPPAPEPTTAADRRLLIGGGACVALTLAGVVLRLAGVLPSGIATVVVLVVAAIGLRLYVGYAARSASSAHRTRVVKLIALVGLGVSVVTLVAAMPVMLRGGGTGGFVANTFSHLWTLLLLLLAVGSARTLGWQPLLGMGLTGFLGLSGLAYAVGRPVVNALGTTSVFATAVYAPVTEEILKALPVVLLLVLAVRRRELRPSAVEMALLGACIGAGFALYEDIQYHRGGFQWGAMPLVSLLNPSGGNDAPLGLTYGIAGHMVDTALIALGLGVTLLYRRRFRWALLAAPVAVAAAVLEHITQNYASAVFAGTGSTVVFDLLRVVTLWGWSSSLLLIGGVGWFAWFERRGIAGGARRPFPQNLLDALWRPPATSARTAAALARLQLPEPAPAAAAMTGVVR